MSNLKMFCLTMNSSHLKMIKDFSYIPVGLGKENFSREWLKDDSGENISKKNKYYGEYTFHYWVWKNYLDKLNDGWIGFCQYRKFWSDQKEVLLPNSLTQLKPLILKEIPKLYEDFDVILGDESFVNKFKLMKFLKRGLKVVAKNPSSLFNKNKRTIKFHFNMWHGSNFLNKAIELLDTNDRHDFEKFVNTKVSFNPHNMFICKSKKIMKDYYETIFPWLERCEKEFGFENLIGYGETRIYGFLAERFLSYWFQKNTKYKTMPIIFHDVRKDLV